MNNRAIKFRAFHRALNEYVPVCRYAVIDNNGALTNDDLIFEQFTGLHDKNGRELHEGDIVCRRWEDAGGIIESTVDVVTMDRFPVFWLENEDFGCEGEGLASPEMYELIGNIHENKELLS